ncbi:ABC transporter substrate-binding protein [Haladaptatus sp. T7]|uniref:ABC transporter substrate-binding protein n=1 Tax=Haladaptatus sp. T7 TaxID=2029368 RepID=UPI0021A251AF|nr:ABC transporter substrate-binding protein [Haladaptatus sp. T7]GKZ13044.1 ABC transporter substrate-binding protein [Haladaptatus sp. T7]
MTDKYEYSLNRRRFLTVSALGGATALAGCGGKSTTGDNPGGAGTDNSGNTDTGGNGNGGAKGGTFVNTAPEDATTLDPRMNELAWANGMLNYIFDPLLAVKPDGSEVVPHLAKEKPKKQDETTYTVPIRQGVTFHDGSKLTADDVEYSFSWVLNPDNKSTNQENLAFIDNVKKSGDYEVTFNLKHPYALFELTLAGMNAAIIPKKAAESKGQKKFAQEPVGSGPFKLKDWQSGSDLTLERFDDYFLEAPNLKQLKYRIIPKASVQFVELATGNVHQAGVPKDLLKKAQGQSNIQMKRISQFDYNGLIFNAKHEPFGNRKVRKAMQYLVDYDEMLKVTKGELGKRVYGFMPKEVNEAWDFPWKEWKEKYYPAKDHDKAKQLLNEAGYGDGFSVNMSTHSSGKFKNMAIMLQNEMDKVGINAEVQEVSIGEWLDQLDTGEYDVTFYGWSGGQDPDGFYYYLFRDPRNDDSPVPDDYVGNASAGMLYEAHPDSKKLQKADEKIRKARELQSRDERRQLYIDAAETFMSEYPHIPVYSEQSATAWSKKVNDYEPTAFVSQPLCNEWSNSSLSN